MSELQEFLDSVAPRQQAADEALHNGDVAPRKELWSRNDPVTLLGAFGVAASGWDEVGETFDWVASRFSKCDEFRFDVIAAGVSGDLAYTVGYEHSLVSRDGGPVTPNRPARHPRLSPRGWRVEDRPPPRRRSRLPAGRR